jgi:hypothetical protein
MTILADYTPDEQLLLLRSISAAAIAISAASPGRRRETAAEGIAAAVYVMESKGDFLDNTLVGSVQHELDRRVDEGVIFPNFEEQAVAEGAGAAALVTLREAAALLDAKAEADEGAGYKRWLMGVAQQTALGGTEGGNWLGWGAVQVNEAERTALVQVAQALGVPTE